MHQPKRNREFGKVIDTGLRSIAGSILSVDLYARMKTIIKTADFIVVGLSLVWLTGFGPNARAVNPPPDGDYPSKNTAEGQDALSSLTNGTANTAIGFDALKANTMGDRNTANGAFALFSNQTGSDNTATGYAALFTARAH